MKLFSPQQSREVKAAEDARLASRIEDLRREEAILKIKTAKVDLEFRAALDRHRLIWEQEDLKHKEEVNKRRAEIKELESAKKKALEPVEFIEARAKRKEEEADKKLAEVAGREISVAETAELLESRLEEVGELKTDLEVREKKIKVKEDGLKISLEQFKTDRGLFDEAVKRANAEYTRLTNELDKRSTEITLNEKKLSVREGNCKAWENELKKKELLLEDRRKTLEREEKRRIK